MCELLGQLEVLHRQPVVMSQRQRAGQEADQLVHLGLEVLPPGEKLADESVTGREGLLGQLGQDSIHGGVVVCLEIVQSLPRLEPLFEEVLVVGVPPGPQRDGAVGPKLPVVCIDEDGHQSAGLGQSVYVLGDPGHRLLVLGLPGHPAEVPELQLHGGHLGGGAVRAPLGGVTHPSLQIHVRKWNS